MAESGAHLRNARENVEARRRRIRSAHRLAVQQTVAVRHIDGDALLRRDVVHAYASGTAQIDERHVEVDAADARRSVAQAVSLGVWCGSGCAGCGVRVAANRIGGIGEEVWGDGEVTEVIFL